jgi:hypothetical protein
MYEDLYNNLRESATGTIEPGKVHELIKAMSASSQTGRDLTDTATAGSALKTESLDPSLKVLTNTDKHIVLWKMIPKQKAYNTVEEYNQLVDYGGTIGIFNNEGETPQFTDSIYTRRAALIKYTGVSGEVTHPFTLVNLGSGVGNALAKEVSNKTQYLVRGLDGKIVTANSTTVSQEFDGIMAQHFAGVSPTLSLDIYANNSAVIDVRGKALKDENVEDAAQAVVNDNFGMVSTIIGNPLVFSSYVKRFHESKRVNVGQSGAVQNATMGQSVNQIQTQFGLLDVANDIFFDRDRLAARAYNQAATSTKAPTAPVTGGAPSTQVDTSAKFADGAGDYFYAVSAKNRYGESALTILATNATTVAVTESVDLSWTHTDGSYAAESFVVYRTIKDADPYTTAGFYPIFEVSVAQHTAGYDGGAATVVRDRNRRIANTTSALVLEFSTDVIALKQLAPMMRMDLARTSPSYRFMVLDYCTPVLFAPKKISKIENIGTDLT